MELRNPTFLMVVCTLFLATGQFFQKIAGERLELTIAGFLLNWPFWVGLVCAGFGAILMTIALRRGELSKIFPLVSLSFVWTAIIAVLFFNEIITFHVVAGIVCVIIGIVVLGRSGVGA